MERPETEEKQKKGKEKDKEKKKGGSEKRGETEEDLKIGKEKEGKDKSERYFLYFACHLIFIAWNFTQSNPIEQIKKLILLQPPTLWDRIGKNVHLKYRSTFQ